MTDSAISDRLWAQIEPTVFISKDEFVRGLENWDIEAVIIGGQLSFVTLTRGPEFHFASFDTGAPITRTMIRDRMNAILAEHGYVTTRTPIEGANRQHRINKALGFVAIGSDEFMVTYKMDKPCR